MEKLAIPKRKQQTENSIIKISCQQKATTTPLYADLILKPGHSNKKCDRFLNKNEIFKWLIKKLVEPHLILRFFVTIKISH